MAKPYLKPNSTKYQLRLKLWDTVDQKWKWKNKSSGTDDYDLAVSLQESLQNAAYAAQRLEGKQVDQDHIKALLTGIYASAGVIIKSEQEWPTIGNFIDRFLAERKQNVKPNSYKTYWTYLNHFKAWLKGNIDKPLDWFTPERACDYYAHCLKRLTIKTANERIKIVSRIYKRAMKLIKYPSNPCDAVDLGSIANDIQLVRIPFTLDEVNTLITYLLAGDGKRREWGLAAAVSAMSGARLEDALRMRSESITGNVLAYTQGKTGKRIEVPLVVATWRKELQKCEGDICPTLLSEFENSGNSHLSGEFSGHVIDAGIEQKYTKFKTGRKVARKTFHSLRHTLRTLIVSSGGSDAQADIILGHSGDQGKTYTHSELDAMKVTLKKVFK